VVAEQLHTKGNKMNLHETINKVQGVVEIKEDKVPSKLASQFKTGVSSLNGAADYLGDLADDVRVYDKKLADRIVVLYQQVLKVQSTAKKIKF
jgi:hypothetical protein